MIFDHASLLCRRLGSHGPTDHGLKPPRVNLSLLYVSSVGYFDNGRLANKCCPILCQFLDFIQDISGIVVAANHHLLINTGSNSELREPSNS